MLPEWRLLEDGIHEARHHFAVEEALARQLDAGHTPPTLRLRRLLPSVSVGNSQDTGSEVDLDYCRANNLNVVRRMNGGGAIYHEMGSFCFSAIFPRGLLPQEDAEMYPLFATPAIRTCADHGLDARFQGRNDVLAGGRKIYGSAQFSWYGAFVQSGTFLVNIDFAAMQTALTPPRLKFANKPASSIRERVTSLSLEVGRGLDTREVMVRFAGHVAEVLGVRLVPDGLTSEEQALAAELLAVKYSREAWNFGSRLEYQVTVADRAEEGVVCLSADMEDEAIRKARITGDLLLADRTGLDALERTLVGCSLPQARSAVQQAALPAGIRETLLRLLEKLGQETVEIVAKRMKEREI